MVTKDGHGRRPFDKDRRDFGRQGLNKHAAEKSRPLINVAWKRPLQMRSGWVNETRAMQYVQLNSIV